MNKPKYYVDIGDKFGKLTVIGVSDNTSNKKTHYICKCDCGNIKIVDKYSLIQGRTKSCGCLVYKHGGTGTHLYMIWKNIRYRCNNENHREYKNYGGRGITICKEWDDYNVFMTWSKNNGYKDGLSIDRIDGNKGYSPDNCRWIYFEEQSKNKTSNLYFLYNSKIYNLHQLASILNINYTTLHNHYTKYKNLHSYRCYNSSYEKFVEQLNKELNNGIDIAKR